ncbi:MAG: hypothetical protein FJ276_08155 [Planctomycetes bacterium]|nr:hypothetical protein [Planctomycetota bacterium]
MAGCDTASTETPSTSKTVASQAESGKSPPPAPPPGLSPPTSGQPSESQVRAAMLKVVDAERQLRRSIRDVTDGPSAQRALPELESGCRRVIAAVDEYRNLFVAAASDLPLAQIHVDFEQELHKLNKEFPERAIDKMKNDAVVLAWSSSKPFHDMRAAMNAYQEARITKTGGQELAQFREQAEADLSRFRESASKWVGNRTSDPTAPPVPPGFPSARPQGGSPPDPNERPPLDGPPRKNVIVVMRGADEVWTPVMVRDLLPDGRVKVVVMNRVDGKLVPGDERIVDASQLRRAVPPLDLPGP